ncbi:hypothetical protein H0H92_002651 [Tricholoma furcatifolium]|nr:hypothetical protein H0H92_002651 [Tricholoma furcatifolium]
MSRLTSAQVIALGEYLEPTFDPASLTVSQLLGVLAYHNVKYPTPYSKPKLAVLFNEQIKAKATQLKKERIKKENSIASDDGIVDGATGQPLRKEPSRRASRRLSQAPIETNEAEDESAARSQPKRRRSSAQPSLGRTLRKSTAAQPILVEESEPEEDLPVKKVGRSRKTAETAGAQGRRVSTAAEDSGWEDNNIFQSGAESSSPARPSPIRPKTARKSVSGSHKSRKSSSAPPQFLLSSPPKLPQSPDKPGVASMSPLQSKFEPILPSVPRSDQLRLNPTPFTPSRLRTPLPEQQREDSEDELNIIGEKSIVDDDLDPMREEKPQELLEEVMESQEDDNIFKDPNIGESEELMEKEHYVGHSQRGVGFLRVFWLSCSIILASIAACASYSYRNQSASIGYCVSGSTTNSVLDELRKDRLAVQLCNLENRTVIVDPDSPDETKPCPLPPLLPWSPNTCTPCPEHAQCTESSVICERGYLLRPHPLLFFLPASSAPRDIVPSLSSPPADWIWKFTTLLDGVPGFGSVALPSRCVEDPKRKRNIGALGKAIEFHLGHERGHRVCVGGKVLEESIEDIDGGDAKRWGLELGSLREMMMIKTPPHLRPSFDDTFNEAIQQLVQWGGIVIGEDRENLRYVAHKEPSFTWACSITVRARKIWVEWRVTVFIITAIAIGMLYWRARRTQKLAENKRVMHLVQLTLDNLRHQEYAHHTDPVSHPEPYLSSLQLRDLILQDEHSVASRSRIWHQVEHIVEGNANVRTNLEETGGGDELRVWRWVGSAHRRTVAPKEMELELPIDDA